MSRMTVSENAIGSGVAVGSAAAVGFENAVASRSAGVSGDDAAARPARIRFNPFSAEFRRDPYPLYRQLRESAPVHRTLGMWVLTRHADARAVLQDRSFSAGLIPRLVSEQAERLGHERDPTAEPAVAVAGALARAEQERQALKRRRQAHQRRKGLHG